MTISKDSWIFFVVAVLVGFSPSLGLSPGPTDASLRFSLSPIKIEAGERATLEVRLEKNTSAEPPRIQDSLLSQAEPFILLHSENKEDEKEYVWRYDLTAYRTGEYAIPPLLITYGPNTFSTERQTVTVTTLRQENDVALREDYPKLWPPIPWKTIALSILIFGLVGSACFYLYKRIKNFPWHKYKKPLPTTPPKGMDPLEWLKKELSALREKTTAEMSPDNLPDELTRILRYYLFLRYQEPFTSRTTPELEKVIHLHPQLTPLLPPFREMDHYKFAGTRFNDPRALVLNGIQIAEKTLCGS